MKMCDCGNLIEYELDQCSECDLRKALAEAQARIKELEGEATGNIHEIDRLLDDSKRLQLRAERAESELNAAQITIKELGEVVEQDNKAWFHEALAQKVRAVRAEAERDAALAERDEMIAKASEFQQAMYAAEIKLAGTDYKRDGGMMQALIRERDAALADNAAQACALTQIRAYADELRKGGMDAVGNHIYLMTMLYNADHPGAALLAKVEAAEQRCEELQGAITEAAEALIGDGVEYDHTSIADALFPFVSPELRKDLPVSVLRGKGEAGTVNRDIIPKEVKDRFSAGPVDSE